VFKAILLVDTFDVCLHYITYPQFVVVMGSKPLEKRCASNFDHHLHVFVHQAMEKSLSSSLGKDYLNERLSEEIPGPLGKQAGKDKWHYIGKLWDRHKK